MTAKRGAARPRRAAGGRPVPATEYLVITGLSGSGKSAAVKALEDLGAYCVDNLPTALLPQMIELTRRSTLGLGLVVLGMDIRERRFAREFPRTFRGIRARGVPIRLLFLDASENVLVRRFSETRRVHPLGEAAPLVEAIRAERRALEPLRALADVLLDTSTLRVRDLRERMGALVRAAQPARELVVTLEAFGFKFGVPSDADLVFDVRFIANPFFEEDLKPLSGLDEPVRAFVLRRPECVAFLERLLQFLAFLLPRYRADGRAYLTVAFGCTGGRHRSPAIARAVAEALGAEGYRVSVRNRDLGAE